VLLLDISSFGFLIGSFIFRFCRRYMVCKAVLLIFLSFLFGFLERLLFPIRIFLKRQISTSPKGLFSLFLFLFLFSFSVLVCFLGGISSQHVSHTTFFFFERFWVIFLFEGFRLYLFAWDGIRDTSYFSKLLSAQGPSSSWESDWVIETSSLSCQGVQDCLTK